MSSEVRTWDRKDGESRIRERAAMREEDILSRRYGRVLALHVHWHWSQSCVSQTLIESWHGSRNTRRSFEPVWRNYVLVVESV